MWCTGSVLVELERIADVVVLRLNRPAKRNALDSATLAELNHAFEQLAADDSVRALVFSTTDPKALCAGADVSEQLDHADGLARMVAFTRLYSWLDEFPAPLIAVAGHERILLYNTDDLK